MDTTAQRAWSAEIKRELVEGILPFWRELADTDRGGFYGAVDCNGTVDREAPRSAVLTARILWTFAAAARAFRGPRDREMADHAFGYLAEQFWDHKYEGVYWMLDANGRPLSDRKQVYAQAFALYALAEHHRATQDDDSLSLARRLYHLLEDHASDRVNGGYLEAAGRNWGALDDMRLSEKDLNCPKSMNTNLHVMEAYTNLLRVWPDRDLKASQTALLNVTMDRIIDNDTGHFRLFFDKQWNSLTGHISFGHDIEGSWLLVGAAEVLGQPEVLERARRLAIKIAYAVYEQARDRDGSLFYEADSSGNLVDPNKHWWAQAEAMVGFYNAYQLSGDKDFFDASHQLWRFISERVIDRAHGEWHAKLKPTCEPFTAAEDGDACLAGPWKCPYHNSRACLEMIARLS